MSPRYTVNRCRPVIPSINVVPLYRQPMSPRYTVNQCRPVIPSINVAPLYRQPMSPRYTVNQCRPVIPSTNVAPLYRQSMSPRHQWCGNATGQPGSLRSRLLEFARLKWINMTYRQMLHSIFCQPTFKLCPPHLAVCFFGWLTIRQAKIGSRYLCERLGLDVLVLG